MVHVHSVRMTVAPVLAALCVACGTGAAQSHRKPRRVCPPPVVDGALGLARHYAPWVLQETHPTGGRQDLPAPVDFDGNLNGDDNWQNLPNYELLPTLYYAHVETATHHFLTFHIFHPRDWEPIDLPLHLTHEGDGENLQVVVSKASDDVVLLFTQAHYRGGAYEKPGAGFGGEREHLRGPILLVDDEGRPSRTGTHAAVFVEAKGHGIYGALGEGSRVVVSPEGAARFSRDGLVLRPARDGEAVAEPPLGSVGPVPYRLESTTAKLWLALRRGELIGKGHLLDGVVPYEDSRVRVALPRYHEGNRLSGPFGPDRGISPFAVDFSWKTGTLGSLFFDPARRYAEVLSVPQPWSLEYINYPFATH